MSHAQRALDRVSSYAVFDAISAELAAEAVTDIVTDSARSAASRGSASPPMTRGMTRGTASATASDEAPSQSLAGMRVVALLHLLVAYDASGAGALDVTDFGRMVVGELGPRAYGDCNRPLSHACHRALTSRMQSVRYRPSAPRAPNLRIAETRSDH